MEKRNQTFESSRLEGFIDWWMNTVKGGWITNEQFDEIYERLQQPF